MTYRDIRYFRTQFKNRRKAFANEYVNEHFIGVQHGDFSGFFQLFHGTKDEIGDFLRGSFDMAEDSQAIYEFIQNAADCNSTQFCLFFDDENFLAVNNGSVFANGGVESILNIGQSYGKKTGDTIGRFGVGFKLVHRLVGVSDGLHEIVDLGAGPMLYSWSNISEIQSFLNTNLTLGSPSQEHEKAPWLLKILLTCFPAQPGEVVKNLQYVDHIPFKEQELDECRKYTCAKFASLDLSDFKQGSLFYLKLGSGKANLLRSEVKELERGASVSLRFLKDLKCIRLNDITLKSTLNWLKPGRIEPDTDEFRQIKIRDEKSRDYPLLIEVGYKTVEETADSLSSTPNFFKYFPIGDEVNRLQFIVHTNAFLIGTNRRHLHNDPINHRILQAVANHITQCMDDYQRIIAPCIFKGTCVVPLFYFGHEKAIKFSFV